MFSFLFMTISQVFFFIAIKLFTNFFELLLFGFCKVIRAISGTVGFSFCYHCSHIHFPHWLKFIQLCDIFNIQQLQIIFFQNYWFLSSEKITSSLTEPLNELKFINETLNTCKQIASYCAGKKGIIIDCYAMRFVYLFLFLQYIYSVNMCLFCSFILTITI